MFIEKNLYKLPLINPAPVERHVSACLVFTSSTTETCRSAGAGKCWPLVILETFGP